VAKSLQVPSEKVQVEKGFLKMRAAADPGLKPGRMRAEAGMKGEARGEREVKPGNER